MAEMTIKEIDAEITRLRNLRYQLEKDNIQKFKAEAQKHVGRCFIVDGRYVMVIDVPQEVPTTHGFEFNKYQFPALFVRSDKGIMTISASGGKLLPFKIDTLFSGIWGDGHDPLQRRCREITPDEFYAYFAEAMHKFRLDVKDIVENRKEKSDVQK